MAKAAEASKNQPVVAQKNDQLEDEIRKLKSEKVSFDSQIFQLQSKINDKDILIDSLQHELESLKETSSHAETIANDVKQLRQQLDDAKQQIIIQRDEQQATTESLKAEIKQKQSKLESLEAKLKKAKDQLLQDRAQIEHLGEFEKLVPKLQNELKENKSQIDSLIKTGKNKSQKDEDEIKSLKKELSQLQTSNYSIQSKLNKLEDENQSLSQKLGLQNESSKSKDTQIDQLSQHIAELENQLHSSELKLNSANQDLNETKKKLSDCSNKLESEKAQKRS